MKHNSLMLKCSTRADLAEAVSWDLASLGANAVEERDSSTMAPAEETERVELIAGFADESSRAKARETIESEYDDVVCRDLDDVGDGWQHKWREFFKPVLLEKLQIVTPWMAVPAGNRHTIVIDPGQAFGTGGHATTQLILRMLEIRAASSGGLPRRILDVGTGSGVLAIAALKLGATEVLGIDIDDESIEAALTNAARNQTADGFSAEKKTADLLSGTWPLVLANIQLDAFLKCAEDIAARVDVDGEVLVSGVLVEQLDQCLALWPGFEVREQLADGEWTALALRRLG